MKTIGLGRLEKKYGLSTISLRRHIKKVWGKYAKEMGVKHFPTKIEFMKYPYPRHMSLGHTSKNPAKTLRVDYPIYRRVYPRIPQKAEKAFRFALAHEIAHVKQFEESKPGHIPARSEEKADEKAEMATGITRGEYQRLRDEIRREYFETLGVPKGR